MVHKSHSLTTIPDSVYSRYVQSFFQEKGIINPRLLLIIAILGIALFFLVASNAPFKDIVFDTLYPKTPSQAATTFLEIFTGAPTSPTAFKSANWDFSVHERDGYPEFDPVKAQHGSDCAAPVNSTNPGNPVFVTHDLTGNYIDDAVFQCRDHLMTAMSSRGYGLIDAAPNVQLDFTQEEGVIRFDLATFRTSTRDWIDINITPFGDQVQLPFNSNELGVVDLQGLPYNAVQIDMQGVRTRVNGGTGSGFAANIVRNGQVTKTQQSASTLEDLVTPSAARRDTFELRLTRTHVKFCYVSANYNAANPGPNGETTPQPKNLCWVDTDIPALSWSKGTVQFGHHAYTPDKGCLPEGASFPGCGNTWHWDNISISPAEKFTMIHPTSSSPRILDNRADGVANPSNIINFEAPAPANAFLRFSAAGTVQYSTNGGQSWQTASKQRSTDPGNVEHMAPYFVPIPQGTQSVKMKFGPDDWYNYSWHLFAKDVAIWAQGTSTATGGPVATPTPLPSTTTPPTSVPTPTRTPNPTVPPTVPPTIAPTQAPSNTPTVNFTASCVDKANQSAFSVSWNLAGATFVDISTNNTFPTDLFSNKGVSGLSSTTGPGGFNVYPSGGAMPMLLPNTIYFVRVYNGTTHTAIASFTTPNLCANPTSTPGVLQGDADNNGTVNIFDYNIVIRDYGTSGTGVQGDLDDNGTVNIFDYNILMRDYGKTS